jgi:hypothetical protein
MTAVHYDNTSLSDDERRAAIYGGDIFLFSPTRSSTALVEFGKSMVREAFAPLHPESAQYELPVERFAAILGELKPKFIHHPRCKELIAGLLAEIGCDPEQYYFDVPRMRTAASGDYLKTGIAYAFHPHRDTWYSAPMCQINWWIPMYPLTQDNCMAFHPRYWTQPLKNSSSRYNYQEWNKNSRFIAAQQIGEDTREQPHALEPVELDPQIRLLPPPGGIIIFSGAQLHSTVPNSSNRTRYSIDFRSVHLGDVRQLRGAENIDSYSTGTTMDDYLQATTFAHLPPAATAPYVQGHPKYPKNNPENNSQADSESNTAGAPTDKRQGSQGRGAR